jgi:hypothetical protein
MRDLASLMAAGTDPDYTLLPHASGINNAGQIISHSVFKGVLLTPFVLGDLDCDELVTQPDIAALLLLLVNPDEYAHSYPDCPGEWAGDVNQDAVLDLADLHALRGFLGLTPGARPANEVPPERIFPTP